MSVPGRSPLLDRLEEALDRLRPALVADGGNVELVDVSADGTVQVVFQGACAACPAQWATLRFGIEAALRAEVPQVRAVLLAPEDALTAASARP